MKHTDKIIATLTCCLALSAIPASADTIVAGWDIWDSASAPNASVTAPDITASAVTTSEQLAWNITDSRGASADGTWGSVETIPSASTAIETGENLELSNATSGGTVTFTITNNGASELILTSFNFDSYAFRPKAARAYELTVLEGGGITPGIIYTSADDEITHVGGNNDNLAHDDIGHSLTGLADHTLAPGETVSFLLAFSSGTGDFSGGHDLWLDNVAVFSGSNSEPPATSNVSITKNGEEVTLTFASAGLVDIYRSADLDNWIEISDNEESPFVDIVGGAPAFFYVVVPTGRAFP